MTKLTFEWTKHEATSGEPPVKLVNKSGESFKVGLKGQSEKDLNNGAKENLDDPTAPQSGGWTVVIEHVQTHS